MAGAHLRDDVAAARRRLRWGAVALLLLGLAIGAAATVAVDAVADDDGSVDAGAVPDSAAVRPGGDGSATATPDPGPITIAFVGDVNHEGSLRTRLSDRPEDFVGPFAELLRSADLAIANLEAALTTGGSAVPKEFTFRAPPEILDALMAGGVDVVSAANNHGIDFGTSGLDDTLATKRARDGVGGIRVIGVGGDEDEAYAPFVADVRGQRVAVIAATQVLDSDLIRAWTATDEQAGLASAKRVDRLVEEIERTRADADTVIVFLHWGVETETCPSSSQQELARTLADAGADLIVGTHAHRVQSGGRLGNAFVGYGLGNFLFGAVSDESAKSGVLLVTVDGRDVVDYEWKPGRISDRVPMPLDGGDAVAAVDEWNDLRSCTNLTE